MSLSRPLTARNGRTKAENVAYAMVANAARSPEQRRAAAEAMRRGRREAARKRIEAKWGPQPADVIEDLIDREIASQMARARAAALTARRKADQALEKAEQAEAEAEFALGSGDSAA